MDVPIIHFGSGYAVAPTRGNPHAVNSIASPRKNADIFFTNGWHNATPLCIYLDTKTKFNFKIISAINGITSDGFNIIIF